MKKAFILLIVSLFATNVIAQTNASDEEVERFFNTKTLVVLDNNPMNQFNYIIKEVLKKEWTITEYDFCTFKEFEEEYRKDPQYSFVYLDIVSFDRDKTDAQYQFLFVSLGGDYNRRNQMPDLGAVPLGYRNVDSESYEYKLGCLVRFLHNHLLNMRGKPKLSKDERLKYYNQNMYKIKEKTLYLIEDDLAKEVSSVKRIKAVYPHDVRIVTKNEIKEAIENKNDDVVFLHKVGPEGTKLNARCYKSIMSASDARLYYFQYHKISDKKPDGILEKDLKKIARSKP